MDRVEAGAGRSLTVTATTVTVLRARLLSRLAPAAGAVAASALVAATAAQDVVPSVGLVLGGLVAAVAALVVTTRVHRDEPADDVHESLSGRVPPGS
jgi:ammonia channel protein AmtB